MKKLDSVSCEKKLHLELLRLISIYLVIFNHTGENGYMFFVSQIEKPVSYIYMTFSILCKIAVPIFFMISGALLLKKEETLKQLLINRVFRMLIVLFVASIPYYLWLHQSFGTRGIDFIIFIYSESATSSLWYLYSYIALLLLMPFLRNMVKNMKQIDYTYLFIGHIVFVGFLPCIEYLLWKGQITIHESLFPVIFTVQNIYFAVLGYYFEHVVVFEKYGKKIICFGLIASLISVILTCAITSYHMKNINVTNFEEVERFFGCYIFIPAVTVYCIFKRIVTKIKSIHLSKILIFLGSGVFGVYLVEKIIRAFTSRIHEWLQTVIGIFPSTLIWCVLVLCLSLLVILPLKHLPIIKKIFCKFI